MKHVVNYYSPPSADDMNMFNYRVGFCVGSRDNAQYYYNAFKTMKDKHLYSKMYGFGGEVSAAYYTKPEDLRRPVTGSNLLDRMEISPRSDFVKAAEEWREGINFEASPRFVVELAYIENRLSSWASPRLYGVPRFAATIIPFADRNFVEH